MDIALEKKAHVFRLPVHLLEKLKELAQKDRRSHAQINRSMKELRFTKQFKKDLKRYLN